jgi:hypothetical protein
MVWYVAFIAILNVGLGYALANYLSGVRHRNSSASSLNETTPDQEPDDEYYSDDQYDEDYEDADLEAAVAR